MSSIIFIIQTLAPLMILVLLGYYLGWKKQIDTIPITNFLIYIAIPCLIFFSLYSASIELADLSSIMLIASIIILFQGTIFFIFLKITKSKKIGLLLPSSIGNSAFIGYPVALFFFGQAGLSHAVIYDITNAFFLYGLGIYFLQRKNGFKEVFKMPLLYALAIGILFNFTNTTIPLPILNTINMIGQIAVPIILILLGYKLHNIKINELKKSILIAFYRIGGGLILAVLILNLIDVNELTKKIILLQSAMPSALMTLVLTEKYGKNPKLVASIVFFSTLISIVSIPLILYFIL